MAQWAALGPGPSNGLTDVTGLEVGHFSRHDPPYLTGTTVVLARGGATAAANLGGGAPATRETDALDPRNLVDAVHAVVLSGGSAYGLDAAGGTMRWLEEHGIGRAVGTGQGELVPIVPAAALFDLGRGGGFGARPDVSFGYSAAERASTGPVAQGNVGAGTGALMGNLVGPRLKGGVGTASVVTSSGITVAALAAVNALGQAVDPANGLPYALVLGFPGEFPELAPASAADLQRHLGAAAPGPGSSSHTVLVVVATDAALGKAEAADLARVAQSGLPRAIRPAHTRFDGDIVFALATGARSLVAPAGSQSAGPLSAGPARGAAAPVLDGGSAALEASAPTGGGAVPEASVAGTAAALDLALALLGQLAADCLSRAVVHALLAATSVGEFIAYGDAFPSVFKRGG
jgi:putative pantetheine hydrolase